MIDDHVAADDRRGGSDRGQAYADRLARAISEGRRLAAQSAKVSEQTARIEADVARVHEAIANDRRYADEAAHARRSAAVRDRFQPYQRPKARPDG